MLELVARIENVSGEPESDVLIVGGGVIGLSTAYCLSRSGTRVTVLDQGQPGQEASWAGAGMLPPGNLEGASTPSAQLRAFSFCRWKRLSQELLELTGIDNGFRESGGLELGLSGEGQRIRAELAAWKAEGVPVETLTVAELRKLEPSLHPAIEYAYRLPTFAQVRNPRHVKALIAACQAKNVRVISGQQVVEFELAKSANDSRTIVAARTQTDRFVAEKFLIASGAWSAGITRQLGIEIPVRPVRGQIALLSTWPLPFQHVLNHGARYLVPREDGKILVGATEEEAGFEKQNTVQGIAGLLEFAQSIVPSLASVNLERTWAGLRPGSPQGDPFLSKLPGCVNGYVAAGHFRAGLQLSPGTGQLMAELILTGKTSISLEAFRIVTTNCGCMHP